MSGYLMGKVIPRTSVLHQAHLEQYGESTKLAQPLPRKWCWTAWSASCWYPVSAPQKFARWCLSSSKLRTVRNQALALFILTAASKKAVPVKASLRKSIKIRGKIADRKMAAYHRKLAMWKTSHFAGWLQCHDATTTALPPHDDPREHF